MKIQGVKTDNQGYAVRDCSDESADTFLVLNEQDIEIMRCSSRALAEQWIAENPETEAADDDDEA